MVNSKFSVIWNESISGERQGYQGMLRMTQNAVENRRVEYMSEE